MVISATTTAGAMELSDMSDMSASEQRVNATRLLLVDDKVILREGMRAYLEQQSGFQVVGQAGSLAEAVALDVGPDVVVTDALLPDAHGNAVVSALRGRYPQAAIFVLTDADNPFPLDSIGATGVGGFVAKTATAAEFLSGLRSVARGVPYVQSTVRVWGHETQAEAWADAESNARERTTVGSLTTKEQEVLRYLVLGHTNAEIAGLCGVSLRTVEARRARLLQKLGVRTRAELVRVAQHQVDMNIERA